MDIIRTSYIPLTFEYLQEKTEEDMPSNSKKRMRIKHQKLSLGQSIFAVLKQPDSFKKTIVSSWLLNFPANNAPLSNLNRYWNSVFGGKNGQIPWMGHSCSSPFCRWAAHAGKYAILLISVSLCRSFIQSDCLFTTFHRKAWIDCQWIDRNELSFFKWPKYRSCLSQSWKLCYHLRYSRS